MINRPSVAGAVLQTPLSLIILLSPDFQNIITPKIFRLRTRNFQTIQSLTHLRSLSTNPSKNVVLAFWQPLTIQIHTKIPYKYVEKSWLNLDKKILFYKNDFVGQNTMRIIFVDQIFIIALNIRLVFPKKNIWQNALLLSRFSAEGGK